MKKRITKKGYRVLAILWTLAAASIAVAFVRRLAEFNLMLLMLLALSALVAATRFRESPNRTSLTPRPGLRTIRSCLTTSRPPRAI